MFFFSLPQGVSKVQTSQIPCTKKQNDENSFIGVMTK